MKKRIFALLIATLLILSLFAGCSKSTDTPATTEAPEEVVTTGEIGVVKDSTLTELVTIINRMKEDHGIEGIILGCTELPLILNSVNCPVRCFDAVNIHLKKLVFLAME